MHHCIELKEEEYYRRCSHSKRCLPLLSVSSGCCRVWLASLPPPSSHRRQVEGARWCWPAASSRPQTAPPATGWGTAGWWRRGAGSACVAATWPSTPCWRGTRLSTAVSRAEPRPDSPLQSDWRSTLSRGGLTSRRATGSVWRGETSPSSPVSPVGAGRLQSWSGGTNRRGRGSSQRSVSMWRGQAGHSGPPQPWGRQSASTPGCSAQHTVRPSRQWRNPARWSSTSGGNPDWRRSSSELESPSRSSVTTTSGTATFSSAGSWTTRGFLVRPQTSFR